MPPYRYVNDNTILIGSDTGNARKWRAPKPTSSIAWSRGLSSLGAWIDDRFPMTKLIKEHATEYYASKNFNIWYGFGVLATVVLVMQLVTGIFLTMNYKPSEADAFASVEYIMRDVDWGWLIRYLHSTGASAFFIVVYLHMFRGLLYGSYKKPRELVWIIGMFIYLASDGRGVLRLSAAVGQHVVLGRAGDRVDCSARSP